MSNSNLFRVAGCWDRKAVVEKPLDIDSQMPWQKNACILHCKQTIFEPRELSIPVQPSNVQVRMIIPSHLFKAGPAF